MSSKQQIVRSLRRYERELGTRVTQRILRSAERPAWLPSEAEIRAHFPTLTYAMRAAGYQVRQYSQRWDEQRIIEAFRAWHARTGKAPTGRSWTKAQAEHPSSVTVRLMFGSWQRALEAAGLASESMPTLRLHTRETIIEALNRWAMRAGCYPCKSDWDRRGADWPPASVVRDVFGSWRAAVDAASETAGYVHERPKSGGNGGRRIDRRIWTRKQIIAATRRWKRETGSWPQASEWQRSDASWPCYREVRAQFDTWDGLLTEAGAVRSQPSQHRRRALPYALQLQVFECDGHQCQNPHCDELDERLTCDHIVAVASGGSDELANLQTLCGTCNSRKGKLSQSEFTRREIERTALALVAA